jgi:hypothetical protein
MIKRIQLFAFLLLSVTVFMTSCGDECDTVCTVDEILDINCNCIPVSGNPCPGVTCDPGFIVDESTCDCIEGDEVIINGNIESDMTLTADKVWILGGRVTVLSGVTLDIEAGTVIKGEAGSGVNSTALLIARGATLNACGTAELPIIMTSVADEIDGNDVAAGNYSSPNLDPTLNGLWGGLIVLGSAPISAQNANDEDVAELQIEGIPTSDLNGLYGGNDPADSSGKITYVSIRHGGTNIGSGNEINGLTLGGVGTGTTINNIEIVANQDDAIEWFGGTVDVDNILVWNFGDDGLDTDQAYNGTVNNFIIITPTGGSAMELDGPEGDFTQGPNNFANGVIYAGNQIDHLIDWDEDTNTGISDVYFFGLEDGYGGLATDPIESFGGDGTGTTGNWEYTLANMPVDSVFIGVPAAALTEVPANGNSVGPDASMFGWTWAAHSGGLSALGL